jgi:hypothetical protein
VDPATLVNTNDPSVLLDLVAQANLAGRAEVTPISKAPLASPVGPADVVNTKDPSALRDLVVAQANLAGRAEVTPIFKAPLASPVDPATPVAAKVRANRPPAAKTRICLSASKSIRRHAGDETGITDYLCAQNAGSVLHKAECR